MESWLGGAMVILFVMRIGLLEELTILAGFLAGVDASANARFRL
jgi:hypothetical protein